MRKTTLNHGGKLVAVPVLSGPVGRPSAALTAKYPQANAPADLAIVDHYLSQLEAVRTLGGAPSEMGFARLLGAVKAVPSWDDRHAAIASLQKSFAVRDPEEVALGLIKPSGDTLKELVDNGDIAEKLLGGAGGARDPREYIHTGRFDAAAFTDGYNREFTGVDKYNTASLPGLLRLLSMMESDASIIDIRWIAYLLATAFVETSHTIRIGGNKNGKPRRGWRNFTPVEESDHGKGRNYYLPVKVLAVQGGKAQVTEEDGDQFIVNPDGTFARVGNKVARPGALPSTTAVPTYVNDKGTPFAYYGRGYVQLTWWFNYASAGVLLSRGLDFLFNPELVMDPTVAYRLMSYCMRTGAGFANGHRLSQYFFGGHTDYMGARNMVNANGDHKEVANAAVRFERVLFASRFNPALLAAR